MLISANSKLDKWIDDFQTNITIPVAKQVAEFARVPLIGLRDLINLNPDNKLLVVALGPFGVENEERHSWWIGFKVVVHNLDIAAAICRLDSNGKGGFSALRLWDIYQQQYVYKGDPAQERWVKSEWAIRLMNEHLADQYHVGFVEDAEAGVSMKEAAPITRQVIGSLSKG